jgi:hypothetical protein
MSSSAVHSDADANSVGDSLLVGDGLGSKAGSVALAPESPDLAQPVLCHYCRVRPGVTRDHVVPRMRLERGKRLVGGYANNSVPSCQMCNGRKGSSRVDCCPECLAKWIEHGPADWEITVPVVSLTYVTAKSKALARQ